MTCLCPAAAVLERIVQILDALPTHPAAAVALIRANLNQPQEDR